jgi:hypothetical protein
MNQGQRKPQIRDTESYTQGQPNMHAGTLKNESDRTPQIKDTQDRAQGQRKLRVTKLEVTTALYYGLYNKEGKYHRDPQNASIAQLTQTNISNENGSSRN